jgi:Ricin-type beta-trefoil lectin domain-like
VARSPLALAAVAGLLAAAIIPAATASTDTAGPTTTFVNRTTGNCLDSNEEFQVYDIPCNGGNYQNWITTGVTTPDGRGAYVIKNAQTGLCLDGDETHTVYIHDWIPGDLYQEWVPSAQDGTLSFESAQTGLTLGTDPGIHAWPADGTPNQQWSYTMIAALPALSDPLGGIGTGLGQLIPPS